MANELFGLEVPSSGASELNAAAFLWRRLMSTVWTAVPVQIVAVSVDSVVGPIGTVDVLPLVKQVDGQGNVTDHTTIYGLPYLRIASNTNAIIMDPQVNDVGIAVFCHRDISSVMNGVNNSNSLGGGSGQDTNNVANKPGSGRWFSPSDGVYLNTIATLTQSPNQTPKQYIQFKEDSTTIGITINSDKCINIQAPTTGQSIVLKNDGTMTLTSSSTVTITGSTINLHGPVVGNSTAQFSGNVTAGSIDLETHVHTGVQTGSGSTGGPTG